MNMKPKELIERWESPMASPFKERILNLAKKGGELSTHLSPFGFTDSGKIDFRGISIEHNMISRLIAKNIDFSHSNFKHSRFYNSVFENCYFNSADFTDSSTHGGNQTDCTFENSKFNLASIGHDNTKYIRVLFRKCNFIRSGYVVPEFWSCQWIDCKLTGVNFEGSFFKDCNFEGKVSDVWFHGYYTGVLDNVKGRKNEMENVSFENATISSLNFSDNCCLKTVKIPQNGSCYKYSNWIQKLTRLEIEVKKWEGESFINGDRFIKVFLEIAKLTNQNWYILDTAWIETRFGKIPSEKIIQSLNAMDD